MFASRCDGANKSIIRPRTHWAIPAVRVPGSTSQSVAGRFNRICPRRSSGHSGQAYWNCGLCRWRRPGMGRCDGCRFLRGAALHERSMDATAWGRRRDRVLRSRAIISELNSGDTLFFRIGQGIITDPRTGLHTFSWPQRISIRKADRPDRTTCRPVVCPVIGGPPEVGGTLAADTGTIEDGNGLDRVKFRFQWVSDSGGTDTIIAGATHSSYTLVADDEGKTVKVRVDFTDRGGYSESVTSTATAPVRSAGERNSGGGSSQSNPRARPSR